MTNPSFPSISDYYAIFGAISIILGMIGFVRAKSRASLIAGVLSGLALLGTAFVLARYYVVSQHYQSEAPIIKRSLADVWNAFMNEKYESAPSGLTRGYIIGLVVSVLLLGRFLPGFLKSKNFYPAGIMAILSLGGVIAGILGLMGQAR